MIDRLGIQPPGCASMPVVNLSGGNQQKAVLARWLRTDPRVLLLDEPTQGVDVGAKASIYGQIRTAAEAGTAVLVASSDAEELVHVCDRVLVFRSGSVAVELTGDSLTEERLVAETLGATSHRKSMRVGREPIRVTVIRSDADRQDEPITTNVGDDESRPAAITSRPVGSRLSRFVRATIDRWRR
jgi:ABC-type multidrug transport system ATPase subunit